MQGYPRYVDRSQEVERNKSGDIRRPEVVRPKPHKAELRLKWVLLNTVGV